MVGITEKKEISFHVNGVLQIVKDEYPLTTSLNYYIRNVLKLTGTKVYCNEGGCGICVVNASVFDQTTNKYKDITVNSCLFPLYSCDGYSFTTVESLGNKLTGIHPIQKRLADKNGSQCGYCSSGFVMSMYSKLKNNIKPTKEEIEKSFDGNICRCTGYRAILDTMKSFAVDEEPIDIEELENMKCLKYNNTNGCCENTNNHSEANLVHRIVKDNKEWCSLKELNDLENLLKEKSSSKFRLVCGNTSIGVYKNQGPYESYINIKTIKELYNVEKTKDSLTIGANVTLAQLVEIFKDVSANDKTNFGHLEELGTKFLKVANTHVRNSASWAGNLALKKEFPDFASDVIVILEAANAKLNIFNQLNADEKQSIQQMSPFEFLNNDNIKPNHYLIESLTLSPFDQEKNIIKFFKVSPRSHNSHSYISCGLRFEFESQSSTKLISKPTIVFNGISDSFYNASKTEDFLHNKDLNDNIILKKSFEILSAELNSSDIHQKHDPLLASPKYRTSLALSLFYKFLVEVNLKKSKTIKDEFKSAIESIIDSRPVSKSEQSFESNNNFYPVTKPISKLNSYAQTCGEVKYVDDISLTNLVHGAFILSTVASAKIESIETDKALKVPGVIDIFFAKDILGENNFMPKPYGPEPLFADKEVLFCGQPIGLVVAETYEIAKKASKMVKVNYTDIKKPILNIHDAIKENSFHDKPVCGDLMKGDPATAIKNSKHQLSGEIMLDSSQFNFYLEGVIAVSEPTDDGFKIECTTQWIDAVQRSVAMVLGINSSCIDVQVKQIGGGFGGKATRGNIPATAASIAAHYLRRPVKVHMNLNDCLDMIGKRPPWFVKYNVGFDEDGKLNGLDCDWYSDPGFTSNCSAMFACFGFFENVYNIPNISVRPYLVKTNKPASVEVRAPDFATSISSTEQIMQHIAEYLNKDPCEVRQANFFKKGDITASGHLLNDFEIEKIVNDLKESTDYYKRKNEIKQFNSLNRYKKRGISLIPTKYSLTHNFAYYNALVSIKHHDGSVAVSHGGIEMGQGLHTKVAQACAFELGIPLEKVTIKNTNNLVNPNGLWSGGSVTSELCVKSVIEACKILKATLEPIRKLMPENYEWNELIAKAFSMNCNLSAMYLQKPGENITDFTSYDSEAAACSEVLVDVLTGEVQILRTDILYDCGQSINGLIDIGQVHGAFVMGLGFIHLEKTIYDPETGKCLNNGTWDYKPPLSSDIPIDFRVKFIGNKPNPVGILGSKATGEPPLILSNSVIFAIKHAIESAREDKGVKGHFNLDFPATVESIQQACLIEPNEFTLS